MVAGSLVFGSYVRFCIPRNGEYSTAHTHRTLKEEHATKK